MFVPDEYRLDDLAVAFSLIEEMRTGTLMTAGVLPQDAPQACHLPFMLDRSAADPATGQGARLIGHMDRRNPQWQTMQERSACRVAFLGPQTYVSPSWYGTAPRAPTWLYVAVHAQGHAELVTDPKALQAMVARLSGELEPAGSGWNSGQIIPYMERLMPYIVGFTITVSRIDAQIRLGQANSADDRARLLTALSGGSASDQAVARLIRRLVIKRPEPGASG